MKKRKRGTILEYYILELLKEKVSTVESQQLDSKKRTTSLPVIINKLKEMGIEIKTSYIRSEGKYVDFLYEIEDKIEASRTLKREGFYWIT